MARKKKAAGGQRGLLIAGVALVAVLAVGFLIWLGQPRSQPTTTAERSVPVNGKTLGLPSAPVEVVEWGDFQ
jgi:hypothetical protein